MTFAVGIVWDRGKHEQAEGSCVFQATYHLGCHIEGYCGDISVHIKFGPVPRKVPDHLISFQDESRLFDRLMAAAALFEELEKSNQ